MFIICVCASEVGEQQVRDALQLLVQHKYMQQQSPSDHDSKYKWVSVVLYILPFFALAAVKLFLSQTN